MFLLGDLKAARQETRGLTLEIGDGEEVACRGNHGGGYAHAELTDLLADVS